jgi:CheY-like chemotaxis protein
VVDDSPEFLELMRELLEADGYTVATCRWAEDAPTRIRQLRPDLLILDVRMQGSEDWRALDQIKADPELAQIPCLVASAAVDQLRRRAAEFTAPGCEVIEKPFELDALSAAVARLLGAAGTRRHDCHLSDPSERSS